MSMNGGARDRALVFEFMDESQSVTSYNCWFTAGYLSEMLHFPKQQMYRILNYLYSQKRIERITHFGYAHRWRVVK